MRQSVSLCSRLVLSLALVVASAGVAHASTTITVPSASGTCGAGNPNSIHFAQSCAARVLFDGTATSAFVQDNTPADEGTYRARFYVNFRGLTTLAGDGFDVFSAWSGADPLATQAATGNEIIRVAVSPGKQLSVFTRLDNGSESQIGPISIRDGYISVELNWAKSNGTNNGLLELWLNGVKCDGTDHTSNLGPGTCSNLTGLDNDLQTVGYVRWGAGVNGPSSGNGIEAGNAGFIGLDDFASQRSGYIGRATVFNDANFQNPVFKDFAIGVWAAEAMAEASVGTFNPPGLLTRAEMAKVLLVSKEGANYTPPACVGPGPFLDVNCGDPYDIWIQELKNRGVTAGCGNGNYCPNNNIDRREMAVFLLATKEGTGYTPPACPPSAFNDIPSTGPGSPFCPWVKEIAARGITAGCGNGNFCPLTSVERQQMAVFVSATFGLWAHRPGP